MQAIAPIYSTARFNSEVEQTTPVEVSISNHPANMKPNTPFPPVIVRELFVAVLAAILLVTLPGCIAATAGVGAVAFQSQSGIEPGGGI